MSRQRIHPHIAFLMIIGYVQPHIAGIYRQPGTRLRQDIYLER